MAKFSDYGRYRWCIKSNLSESGEIYVFADQVEVKEGAAIFSYDKSGKQQINLMLAAGHWTAVFAASVIDGSAVAVDPWKGEVIS